VTESALLPQTSAGKFPLEQRVQAMPRKEALAAMAERRHSDEEVHLAYACIIQKLCMHACRSRAQIQMHTHAYSSALRSIIHVRKQFCLLAGPSSCNRAGWRHPWDPSPRGVNEGGATAVLAEGPGLQTLRGSVMHKHSKMHATVIVAPCIHFVTCVLASILSRVSSCIGKRVHACSRGRSTVHPFCHVRPMCMPWS